jgi:hypothetical protein
MAVVRLIDARAGGGAAALSRAWVGLGDSRPHQVGSGRWC